MKSFLIACTLLFSLPAFSVDWDQEKKNMWRADQLQRQDEWQQQRLDQIRDYQRQWGYNQRNRGYTQESQPDRYRAYDYGQRAYDYRNP